MNELKRVTVAYGDGIGPEITEATLRILEAAGAPLAYDRIEVGEAVYKRGILSGIPPEAWDILRRNKVLLKGPITTPQGGGYQSLNVAIRTTLGLFANVRQARAYAPYVVSSHPGMDVVIIRENEEDLYTGIEYQQTNEAVQTLKLITRPGCERIIRYAFEYARAYGRRKVTCMSKDNIMKLTDGLFHKVFDEIAPEYPEIESRHQIIDIGSAWLAAQPERFEVIVTLNLYGDILSDIAAQIAGSVGLAGSANVSQDMAMFEAVHGSAPDIAGKDVANPSGLLLAAVQMLVHLGEPEVARSIKNAWLCALEDGIHTADIFREGLSQEEVGTRGFTDAVIARLGRQPRVLRPAKYLKHHIEVNLKPRPIADKKLKGVDVFLDWDIPGRDPNVLGARLAQLNNTDLTLLAINNRGAMVYPNGLPETFCSDHWRCRFVGPNGGLRYTHILDLLSRITKAGFEIVQTENLYDFNGKPGYSVGQAE